MNDTELEYARARYTSLINVEFGTKIFVVESDLDETEVRDIVLALIERGGFSGVWRMRGDIWEKVVRKIHAIFRIYDNKETVGFILEVDIFHGVMKSLQKQVVCVKVKETNSLLILVNG